MIVNSNSIALTTHQIAALCAFAGKPGSRADTIKVKLLPRDVSVSATDGIRALLVTAPRTEPGEMAEFSIQRGALDKLRRLLSPKETCVIEIAKGSTAWVRIEEDLDDGVRVRWRSRWHGDVVSTQLDLSLYADSAAKMIRDVVEERLHRHFSSSCQVNADYLAALALVARAAGTSCMRIHPDIDPLGALAFAVGDRCVWSGLVMPIRADEPGPQEDDDALTMPEPLELEVQESTARKARDSRAQAAKEAAAAVALANDGFVVETLEPPVAPRRRGKAKPTVDPEDEAEAALKRRGAKRR